LGKSEAGAVEAEEWSGGVMEWDDGSFVSLFKATSSLVKKFRVKRFSFRKRLSCR